MTKLTITQAVEKLDSLISNAEGRLKELSEQLVKNPRYAASRVEDMGNYAAEFTIYSEYKSWITAESDMPMPDRIALMERQFQNDIDRGLGRHASDYDRQYARIARDLTKKDDVLGTKIRFENIEF